MKTTMLTMIVVQGDPLLVCDHVCLFLCGDAGLWMCRQVNQARRQGSVGDYVAAWAIRQGAGDDPNVLNIRCVGVCGCERGASNVCLLAKQ
jgi:hypothetical protein